MAFSPHLIYFVMLVLASHVMLGDTAVHIWGLRGSGLPSDPLGYTPDPYVKVWCGGSGGGRTETVKNTNSPRWSKEFNFSSCKPGSTLKFEVWDQDLKYDDLLGSCSIRLSSGSYSNAKCSPRKGCTSTIPRNEDLQNL